MNIDGQLKLLSKEFLKDNAIQNKVSTILTDILNMLSKTELSRLASNNSLPGRSKMNKSQLAEALTNCITKPENMENGLVLLDDQEWELLLQFVKNSGPAADEVLYGSYVYARAQGWLFNFYNNDGLHLIMPDEVRKAFTNMDVKKMNAKRQQYLFVIDYIQALVNLNGVVPVLDVYEVIQTQNPGQISKLEFFEVVNQLSARQWVFDLIDNRFVDCSIEGLDEIESLEEQIQGKPQYLPPKEQLLLYKNSDYFEMTPQLAALQKYISSHLCHDAEMVSDLIDDIQLACSMESPLQDIMFEFERRDIEFANMEQLKTVFSLVTDVMNNTRLWSNRGYTPSEISGLTKGEALITPTQAPYLAHVSQMKMTSAKIGRNEPCVCGSGKKYKKCCGK